MRLATITFFLPLAYALPNAALPASSSSNLVVRATPEEITDRLLFQDNMDQFQKARDAKDPPNLDWGSNGCSKSPDNPLGFDFLKCCQRHDFGYRNFKAQNRFTSDNKDKIDHNFKNDMYTHCLKEDNGAKVIACKAVAKLYYEAVHKLGS